MIDIIIIIENLNEIQELNNQLFELEYNNFDSSLKVGCSFEKEDTEYFRNMLNDER